MIHDEAKLRPSDRPGHLSGCCLCHLCHHRWCYLCHHRWCHLRHHRWCHLCDWWCCIGHRWQGARLRHRSRRTSWNRHWLRDGLRWGHGFGWGHGRLGAHGWHVHTNLNEGACNRRGCECWVLGCYMRTIWQLKGGS